MSQAKRTTAAVALGSVVCGLLVCMAGWHHIQGRWYLSELRSEDKGRAERGARGLVRLHVRDAIAELVAAFLPPEGILRESDPAILRSLEVPMVGLLLEQANEAEEESIRRRLGELLVVFAPAEIDVLCEQYEGATDQGRITILVVLAHLGIAEPCLERVLMEGLADETEKVRWTADAILRRLGGATLCRWLTRFGRLEVRQRAGVARGFAVLVDHDCPDVVSSLVRGLDDPDLGVRAACAFSLAVRQEDSEPVVRRLMRAYREEPDPVRKNALWALAVGKSLLPVSLFIEGIDSDDQVVASRCTGGLSERGADVVRPLLLAAPGTTHHGRSRIRYVIGEMEDKGEVCAAIRRAADELQGDARTFALSLLPEICK